MLYHILLRSQEPFQRAQVFVPGATASTVSPPLAITELLRASWQPGRSGGQSNLLEGDRYSVPLCYQLLPLRRAASQPPLEASRC